MILRIIAISRSIESWSGPRVAALNPPGSSARVSRAAWAVAGRHFPLTSVGALPSLGTVAEPDRRWTLRPESMRRRRSRIGLARSPIPLRQPRGRCWPRCKRRATPRSKRQRGRRAVPVADHATLATAQPVPTPCRPSCRSGSTSSPSAVHSTRHLVGRTNPNIVHATGCRCKGSIFLSSARTGPLTRPRAPAAYRSDEHGQLPSRVLCQRACYPTTEASVLPVKRSTTSNARRCLGSDDG